MEFNMTSLDEEQLAEEILELFESLLSKPDELDRLVVEFANDDFECFKEWIRTHLAHDIAYNIISTKNTTEIH